MTDDDDDELDLFVEAQDTVWNDVLAELRAGKKRTHWMWFVFPQLASLGQSDMAKLYGLNDLAEATEFYHHPVLGPRLDTVVGLLLQGSESSAKQIFGSTDAKKLKSCATLFAAVPGAPPAFEQILSRFFDGRQCSDTVDEISD
ncbi:DUF1810 domain-containing protein [Yoonia sp.]|uniref:DUF1810 domain-containing protein n=1 Tax=Yoonia sp. TaxID=2212373 RepID=UPI0019FA0085|nr:DUF1810 domain-containing protein [Yoonia sp.]MBE0413121.1 DUF1810 domain-containing protein [Yoonia sp.]